MSMKGLDYLFGHVVAGSVLSIPGFSGSRHFVRRERAGLRG